MPHALREVLALRSDLQTADTEAPSGASFWATRSGRCHRSLAQTHRTQPPPLWGARRLLTCGAANRHGGQDLLGIRGSLCHGVGRATIRSIVGVVNHLLYVNCWVVMNEVPTGSSGLCPGRGSLGPGNALSVLVSLGPWATWDSQSNKVTSYRGFGHAVSSPSPEGGRETEGWTGGGSAVSRGSSLTKTAHRARFRGELPGWLCVSHILAGGAGTVRGPTRRGHRSSLHGASPGSAPRTSVLG